MPYGPFNDNEHFQEGINLSLSKDFGSVDEFVSYVSKKYGDNADLVIMGYAAQRMAEGMLLEGKVILHKSGVINHVKNNKELRRVLDQIHELGEKEQEEMSRRNIVSKENPELYGFDVDKFLAGLDDA